MAGLYGVPIGFMYGIACTYLKTNQMYVNIPYMDPMAYGIVKIYQIAA